MPAEIRKRRFRRKKWRNWEEGEVPLGAYIVPNLFTTANLFSGFFGIVSSINGHFQAAAIAVFISCVFDILDGKVARLTRATSRFGVEYDSLADLVAFGVGPGILVYLWGLKEYGRIGWLAAFVFVACGALRLARFNVQVEVTSKKYFTGLPIPGAATMAAITVLFLHNWRVGSPSIVNPALLIMTYLLGFLMVSTIPFFSFKEVEVLKAKPIPVLFGVILLVTVVAIEPEPMLFGMLTTYVISGPVGYLVRRSRGENPKGPGEALEKPKGEKTEQSSQ